MRTDVSAREGERKRPSQVTRRGSQEGRTLKPRTLRRKARLDAPTVSSEDLNAALRDVQLAEEREEQGRLAAADVACDERRLPSRERQAGALLLGVRQAEREAARGRVAREAERRVGRDRDGDVGVIVLGGGVRVELARLAVELLGVVEEVADAAERDVRAHEGREEPGSRDCARSVHVSEALVECRKREGDAPTASRRSPKRLMAVKAVDAVSVWPWRKMNEPNVLSVTTAGMPVERNIMPLRGRRERPESVRRFLGLSNERERRTHA